MIDRDGTQMEDVTKLSHKSWKTSVFKRVQNAKIRNQNAVNIR